MKKTCTWLRQLCCDESGVTSVEYALVGTLIALVIVTALLSAGGSLNTVFTRIAGCIANPRGGACT